MKKFEELEKKQKITLAVIIALLACGVIGGIVYAAGADEPDKDAKKQIEQQVDDKKLTDKEKAAVEKLEKEMDKELAAAKTDKEKKAILEKYAEKISKASGGKVKIDTEVKADKEKDKDKNDKKSDKDSNKGNAGSSSSSGTSSSSGSTSGSSGGSSSGSSSGNSGSSGGSAEKPKEKVWVVDQEAWTEEFTNYESKEYWWVKYQDGYVYETFDENDAYNRYGEFDSVHGLGGSWGNGVKSIPYTETIYHEEKGHWEWR